VVHRGYLWTGGPKNGSCQNRNFHFSLSAEDGVVPMGGFSTSSQSPAAYPRGGSWSWAQRPRKRIWQSSDRDLAPRTNTNLLKKRHVPGPTDDTPSKFAPTRKMSEDRDCPTNVKRLRTLPRINLFAGEKLLGRDTSVGKPSTAEIPIICRKPNRADPFWKGR